MGLRRTIIFLAVIIGLLALLYSTEIGTPEAEGLGTSLLENRRLLAADRIIIKPSGDRVQLELFRARDGYFYLEEPVKDLASGSRLTAIAGSYDSARIFVIYEGDEVTGKILEETGLGEPQGYLQAHFADGKSIRIEIGLAGAMGNDLYIGKEGKIYRGEISLQTSLEGNPDDYRERILIRNRPSQVRLMKISRNGKSGRETLVLERRADLWVLTEPEQLRLDQRVAKNLFASVMGLRADQFVPGRLNTGSLDPGQGPEQEPDVVVEIEGLAGKERLEFFVQGQGALLGRALSRDILFTCDSGTYSNVFSIPIQQIRARWLLPFSIDDVDRIKFDPGLEAGAVWELVRRANAGFRLQQPVEAETNATAVSKLLQVLREFFVQSFVADGSKDLARYGLDHGYLSVQLHDAKMGRTLTLHLGDDQDQDLTYLRRADEPHVVTVSKVVADRLRWHWTEYLSLVALEIKNHLRVERIECSRGQATSVYLRDQGEWRRQGAEAAIAIDRFGEFFDDVLRDLVGRKAIDPASAVALPEALELRLMRAGGQAVDQLLVYDLGEQRVLVRRSETGALIELTRRDARDLLSIWPKQ